MSASQPTKLMIDNLKRCDQDFEWYPTTSEIIETIRKDYASNNEAVRRGDDICPSVLDCGAGDGRVLNALTSGRKYAIEKARPLLNALDKDIFVVGTEFTEQVLIDKQCDIVFSNPPYSSFIEWSAKIIKEANAGYIYLVIPSRWKKSDFIQDCIKLRGAKAKIIGSFDFLNADRQARAKVDIVRIRLKHKDSWSSDSPKTSPFDIWFSDHFKLDINKEESSKYDYDSMQSESLSDRLSNELVTGVGLVSILEELYQRDLNKLIATYKNLCSVDAEILRELDVNIKAVRGALQTKIEGLKDRYWHELFSRLNTVTDKLTASSREALLSTLTAHTHVDFTSSNAQAVVMWVIKNANGYFDSQVISMVETMTEKANVILYSSNQRTFGEEKWRFCKMPDDLDRYKLDYRIVLERMGGICTSMFSYDSVNGLSKRSAIFLNDLCTIATNLGFDTYGLQRAETFEWESRVKRVFEYRKIGHGVEPLFEARCYLNGNIHLRMNPNFICRLNLEFGRLKGWLKSKDEAADELDISIDEADQGFGANYQLTNDSVLKLGFSEEA